jgi:2,4-dienoyl-CoA reductase-like NADH-dependent reductase (Old Yellow Enzyme family)
MNPTILNTPIDFPAGKRMKNRFMLAPMTNKQSHENGRLSEDELHWLSMRAKGQFGIVMTCASNVQAIGKCWSGQLGIYSDDQLPGHRRLASKIQEYGSLAVVQLHHGGMRSPEEFIGERPVCPSDNEEFNARGMSLSEVEKLRDDFITAGVRAQKAGYDGVEVHGAHGYILTQFLSSEINHRADQYGGSLENRSRIIFEILRGIREECGPHFLVGIRLSPERFGMEIREIKKLSQQLIDSGDIDFLDLSLWNVFKPEVVEEQSLVEYFMDLDRKGVYITAAGKLHGAQEVNKAMEAGLDFVTIGKSAILHHDFPVKVMENPDFQPIATPVSVEHLQKEGLGPKFIEYMKVWKGFVVQ